MTIMNTTMALINSEIDHQSLALELARNHLGVKKPVAELLSDLGIEEEYFLDIANDPLFKRQVTAFTKELEENGVSFQLKAKVQAEEMLKRNWRIVHDPETPAAVAVKAIENTVRWAGLEPKNNPVQTQQGAGFQIIFNIPDMSATTPPPGTPPTPAYNVIEHEDGHYE